MSVIRVVISVKPPDMAPKIAEVAISPSFLLAPYKNSFKIPLKVMSLLPMSSGKTTRPYKYKYFSPTDNTPLFRHYSDTIPTKKTPATQRNVSKFNTFR